MVLSSIALLIPAFALLLAPPVLPVWLLCSQERSPTPWLPVSLTLRARACARHPVGDTFHQSQRFGRTLSLATLSVPAHSTSELLRTLSMMAASKPTSWLSRRTHSLSHSAST